MFLLFSNFLIKADGLLGTYVCGLQYAALHAQRKICDWPHVVSKKLLLLATLKNVAETKLLQQQK